MCPHDSQRRITDSCDELWRRLVEAETAFYAARGNLFTSCRNELVDLTRSALEIPQQRVTALGVIQLLTVEERQLLLPDLLSIACFNHGQTEFARELVLALPHQWLINNIEEAAEPLLRNNDYEEYQGLFDIYIELDLKLAKKLAQRAANHSDVDIQDSANRFFQALTEKGEL